MSIRAQPTNPLRGSVPVAKLGFPRASGGQDAQSERPARWHGFAPSMVGGDRGLGGLVVRAWWVSGAGWPNGPPSPRLAPGGFYALARAEYG